MVADFLDAEGRLARPGVFILNGPSGSGKGTVAACLLERLAIPRENHLSMGEILRSTIERAKSDASFRQMLAREHAISVDADVFACADTCPELTAEVQRHLPALEKYFGRKTPTGRVSPLEWLEYCTLNGLLVPNRWTQEFIAAYVRVRMREGARNFLIDGYPRRLDAAKHLVEFLSAVNMPVLHVFHIFIGKVEMMRRARLRARADDDEKALNSRFDFYIDSVQPTIDWLKGALGSRRVSLIDGHQPVFIGDPAQGRIDLEASVRNVVADVLKILGE